MNIVLLGPPGVGKGTQAIRLSTKLKLVHISTGDLLRQAVKDKTSLGLEAQGYMEKGKLVPDEIVTQLVAERISKDDAKKGFILDGFPRNLNQAKLLDTLLGLEKIFVDRVINLEAHESILTMRLSGRRVCSKCNRNFHTKNMAPKKEGICDSCGGTLYQRNDDTVETIQKRLEVYYKESAALVGYYQKKNNLVRIQADDEADEVYKRIVSPS